MLAVALIVSSSPAQTPLQSATAPPLRVSRTPAPSPTLDMPASPEELRQRPSLENGLSGAVPLSNDTNLGRPSGILDDSPNGANMSPNGAPRTTGALVPRVEDETAAINAGKTSEGTRAASSSGGAEGDVVGAAGARGALAPESALRKATTPLTMILSVLVGAALFVGAYMFAMLWVRRPKSQR